MSVTLTFQFSILVVGDNINNNNNNLINNNKDNINDNIDNLRGNQLPAALKENTLAARGMFLSRLKAQTIALRTIRAECCLSCFFINSSCCF